MTAEWNEKEVFLQAISLSGEDRERYLREACPDDAAAERVRGLVRAHEEATRAFFDPAVTASRAVEGGALPPGFDEFRILRQIGVGGMGVVYLAKDEVLDRVVALKVLSTRLTDSAKARARFADEARLAAALRHPAIVTVYKFGEVGEACYIASEYVEGPTFEQMIQEHIGRRGPEVTHHERRMWRREAAEACAAVSEALQAAHAAQIVHRDVKPSNILMDQRSGARLTDFGIAKRLTEADLGQQTAVVGSCHYMSPEQASIEATRVDERSDIFSLGVTLYEALALRKPFDGATVHDVLRAIQSIDAPRLRTLDRGVDRDLETICHKALEKRPVDRYQTAAHMAADLRCWLRGDPILARPPSPLRRARRLVRRHRGVAAALALLLIIGATVMLVRRGEETRANLAFLRNAVAGETAPESLSTQALAEIVARGARLLEARGALPEDLEQLRVTINDLLRERLSAAQATLDEVDDSVGRVEEAVRAARFDEVERAARNLAIVCLQDEGAAPFVDDALVAATRDLASQQSGAIVTVDPSSLAGAPDGHRLFVSTLMQHPGSPVEIDAGDASQSFPVDRGYYRFAVRDPDGRVREFTRSVRLRERIVLEPVWSRPQTTEDMALIEGSTLIWPRIGPYEGMRDEVESFLIDRYEVSNREYRAFFDTLDRASRERRRPLTWTTGGYPHGIDGAEYADHPWDDLPVTDVTWFSANAYAEWAGKRLPTFTEWMLAAVGPDWREHPFVDALPDGRLPANIYAGIDARYAESAVPVRSMPEGATPEGVHHLYGNVYEWTESVGFIVDDEGLERPSENSRMLLGYAWDAAARGQTVNLPRRYEADQFATFQNIGFRCAMSLGSASPESNEKGPP